MNLIVALTGGIGSGKSTVADLFFRLGVPIVDADIIARQLVLPGKPAFSTIVSHFGQSILDSNGQLNRTKLRELIFSQPQEKCWLEDLLHPLIREETQRQLATIDDAYAIWVVPLLIENELQKLANRILVVNTCPQIQLERAMQRDKADRRQIKNILHSQTDNNTRLGYADDIIDNNGNLDELAPQVERLHHFYLSLTSSYEAKRINT